MRLRDTDRPNEKPTCPSDDVRVRHHLTRCDHESASQAKRLAGCVIHENGYRRCERRLCDRLGRLRQGARRPGQEHPSDQHADAPLSDQHSTSTTPDRVDTITDSTSENSVRDEINATRWSIPSSRTLSDAPWGK